MAVNPPYPPTNPATIAAFEALLIKVRRSVSRSGTSAPGSARSSAIVALSDHDVGNQLVEKRVDAGVG
jgi:hypothetical protein